jgi:flagellar motor component MotA
MGLITGNRMTDVSFTRLLQVSALLFVIGAVIGGLAIRNPAVAAEPVPDGAAAPVP